MPRTTPRISPRTSSRTSSRTSVIVCAYTEERWDDLLAGVAALKRQTSPALEIIVVIDHNPALLARARTIDGITLTPNHNARGLSGARNSGIAIAQGDIIAFIDEDAAAAPDWLARLEAHYDDPNVIGVGGFIQPWWLGGDPRWFPAEFNWVVGCSYLGLPEKPAPVRNLIGCNMSFRREVFSEVGGFRDGIGRVGSKPVGCEETELCIRTHSRWPQGVILYDPAAQVRHRVPAARATWRYFRARCHAEGLSKALVARLVGSDRGLSSERSYTLKTLPRGVVTAASDALFRGDSMALLRAGAILAGLFVTAFGYAQGRLSSLSRRPRAQPGALPNSPSS